MGICCLSQEAKMGLCINLEGWNGEEMGGNFKREGIYVYLGSGNPLQYSCLENPMDRGAW